MAAEANYGGRVTDIHDRRTIKTILDDFYNIDVVNENNHALCRSDSYLVPNSDLHNKKADFLEFIENNLPAED